MRRSPTAPLLATLLVPFLLAACDETDGVSVRIHLRDDLSGTIRTSALERPASDGAVVQGTQGAVWGSRVDVACASGTFTALSGLRIGDIEFSTGDGGAGVGFARVLVPRGEGIDWPTMFVPLSDEERREAASALDPSGRSEAVGSTLKIEIELPSEVVGNGLTGKTRGTKVSQEGTLATLVVPIETMRSEGDPVVWHLTWQR